jgi:hypothetical protein
MHTFQPFLSCYGRGTRPAPDENLTGYQNRMLRAAKMITTRTAQMYSFL